MKIGTKSILYGAHCWFIHPWFVAWAWTKQNGFPANWRYWVMFFVHDLGYWGKPNMDGPEGEEHVKWGANLMLRWFGVDWYYLTINHSRYWAKKTKMRPSRLCYADKLAWMLIPFWIFVPLVWLTGEWKEHRDAHAHETGISRKVTIWEWYWETQQYMKGWLKENKCGKEDTWTKVKPTSTQSAR